jgi:hypothetical protein
LAIANLVLVFVVLVQYIYYFYINAVIVTTTSEINLLIVYIPMVQKIVSDLDEVHIIPVVEVLDVDITLFVISLHFLLFLHPTGSFYYCST